MKKLDELYNHAEKRGIAVLSFDFERIKSLSVCEDGFYSIGIDPMQLETHADELSTLAHEVGHCETGSFYSIGNPHDLKARHEYRADRWAADFLCPKRRVISAIAGGECEVWQLAEHFSVTEDFMRRALSLYHLL